MYSIFTLKYKVSVLLKNQIMKALFFNPTNPSQPSCVLSFEILLLKTSPFFLLPYLTD